MDSFKWQISSCYKDFSVNVVGGSWGAFELRDCVILRHTHTCVDNTLKMHGHWGLPKDVGWTKTTVCYLSPFFCLQDMGLDFLTESTTPTREQWDRELNNYPVCLLISPLPSRLLPSSSERGRICYYHSHIKQPSANLSNMSCSDVCHLQGR